MVVNRTAERAGLPAINESREVVVEDGIQRYVQIIKHVISLQC